jgi:uncharacterized cupredoxin-like copper-binding protein
MPNRIAGVARAAAALVAATVIPALHPAIAARMAPADVRVELVDPSADPHLAHMAMRLDHRAVHAGRVRLDVVNRSARLVHELVLVRLDGPHQHLPFDAGENAVDEHGIHSLGEVPDLAPGAQGVLEVTLTPGSYLLICNQPGHYRAGMQAPLLVAP